MINWGCVESPKDNRDYITTAFIPVDLEVPKSISYRKNALYVRSQGMFGTCVGFGGMAVKNIHEHLDNNLPSKGMSPLYLYARCKQLDGIPNIEGTYLRVAMKALQEGMLSEQELPYDILLNTKKLPAITGEMIQKGVPYRIISYAQVPLDISAIKTALSEQGPLMFSAMTTMSLIMPGGPYIGPKTGSDQGRHCMVIIGYDDDKTETVKSKKYKGFFEIQNSWGTSWADNGFAWVPYEEAMDPTFIREIWSSNDHINNPDKPKYHRVQLGAFRVKANAENLAIKLKKDGYPIYILRVGDLYKVQTGAFLIRTNADRLLAELVGKGYSAFVTYY